MCYSTFCSFYHFFQHRWQEVLKEHKHKQRLSLFTLLPHLLVTVTGCGCTEWTEHLYLLLLKHLFTCLKSLTLPTDSCANLQCSTSTLPYYHPSPAHPKKDDLMLRFLILWRMEPGSTTTQSLQRKRHRDLLLDLFKATTPLTITLLERKQTVLAQKSLRLTTAKTRTCSYTLAKLSCCHFLFMS